MCLDGLRCRADRFCGNRDPAGLHGFRNVTQKVDVQEAILQRSGGDFHMIGKLEAALESARGDAAIENFSGPLFGCGLLVALGLDAPTRDGEF